MNFYYNFNNIIISLMKSVIQFIHIFILPSFNCNYYNFLLLLSSIKYLQTIVVSYFTLFFALKIIIIVIVLENKN